MHVACIVTIIHLLDHNITHYNYYDGQKPYLDL
jgi:hypothetical protein